MPMERQKAKRQKVRWQKSEDVRDLLQLYEKVVTLYVASRLHRRLFYVAIFICHIKTNTPAFQQMQMKSRLLLFSKRTPWMWRLHTWQRRPDNQNTKTKIPESAHPKTKTPNFIYLYPRLDCRFILDKAKSSRRPLSETLKASRKKMDEFK